MIRSRRQLLILLASLLVSAAFLWLALRDIPLQEVGAALGRANPLWVLVAALLIAGGVYTRGVRWRGLLDNRVPVVPAGHMLGITFMVNQLPLRAGEVARSVLAMRYGVPFVTAATSVVVERLIDTVLVVVVLSLSLAQLPDADPAVTRTAALFGIFAIVAFVILLFFAHRPKIAHAILNRVRALLPFLKRLPLEKLLDHFIDGLQPLTDWRRFAHALVWTLIAWTFSFATAYTMELALGIEAQPAVNLLLGAFISVSLAAFSLAIPVTMAALGPFEGAVLLAGGLVGIDAVTAAALGFLFHGVTVATYCLLGVIGLLALGVSLGGMLREGAASNDTSLDDTSLDDTLSNGSADAADANAAPLSADSPRGDAP